MFRRFRSQGPWLVASAVVLGLLISSFAVASGEGSAILGGKRNPGSNASAALTKRDADHRQHRHVRHAPVQQVRQRRRRHLRLPLEGRRLRQGQRAMRPRQQPGRRPRVRVRVQGRHRGRTRSPAPTRQRRRSRPTPTASRPASTPTRSTARAPMRSRATRSRPPHRRRRDGAGPHAVRRRRPPTAPSAATAARASAARTGAGTYTVVFADDISACALSATETQFEDAGAVGVQLGDDNKTVTVRTRSGGGADGTAATAPTDRPFHLVGQLLSGRGGRGPRRPPSGVAAAGQRRRDARTRVHVRRASSDAQSSSPAVQMAQRSGVDPRREARGRGRSERPSAADRTSRTGRRASWARPSPLSSAATWPPRRS